MIESFLLLLLLNALRQSVYDISALLLSLIFIKA